MRDRCRQGVYIYGVWGISCKTCWGKRVQIPWAGPERGKMGRYSWWGHACKKGWGHLFGGFFALPKRASPSDLREKFERGNRGCAFRETELGLGYVSWGQCSGGMRAARPKHWEHAKRGILVGFTERRPAAMDSRHHAGWAAGANCFSGRVQKVGERGADVQAEHGRAWLV